MLATEIGLGVCQAFRDLIQALSASTFMVRFGSYTNERLDDLEKWQRESVGQIGGSCSVVSLPPAIVLSLLR